MPKHLKSRPLFAQNLPKALTKPKIDWSVFGVAWYALRRVAMVLGFFLLFQMVVALVLLPSFLPDTAPSLPKKMVLYLDLDAPISELPAPVSFADPFAVAAPTLRDITQALDRATDDKRVVGLVVRLRNVPVTLTQSQEFHAALSRFQGAGKFAHIYSSSYGEGMGAMGRYYFASAFDEIWMQPLGVVGIAGLNAELPYFREGLDKLGIEPEFFQRKDYKTAYESVTNRRISPENREMMQRLIDDLRGDIVAGITIQRGIDAAAFERLVDKGILTAQEALEGGLITHADYADVLIEDIKEDVMGNRDADDDVFVGFRRYATQVADTQSVAAMIPDARQPNVALIYAVGAILPTSGQGSPLGAGGVAAADEIAPAILNAADDESVEAIVLWIDSPGGSPTASESILRAIEKAKAKGKIVIVSMGATAASGGYWIAAYADQIFVLPTTITGSIGVVGGKFSLAALWRNIGVNWESVAWGDNARMLSFNKPFSPSEAARFNVMLDTIYDAFVARVAKGREMDTAAVDALAGGRIWSGKRAVENGLADQLGGLDEALDYAALSLELESRNDLNVVVMPKPKTALEQLVMLLEGQVALGEFMRNHAGVFAQIKSFTQEIWRVQNAANFSVYDPVMLR